MDYGLTLPYKSGSQEKTKIWSRIQLAVTLALFRIFLVTISKSHIVFFLLIHFFMQTIFK